MLTKMPPVATSNTYNIPVFLFIMTAVLFVFVPLAVAYTIWIYKTSTADVQSVEIDQRLRAFCSNITNLYTDAMYNKQFMQSGVIGMTGGSILGQLFEMRFINLNLAHYGWNKTDPVKTAIRIVLSIIF